MSQAYLIRVTCRLLRKQFRMLGFCHGVAILFRPIGRLRRVAVEQPIVTAPTLPPDKIYTWDIRLNWAAGGRPR